MDPHVVSAGEGESPVNPINEGSWDGVRTGAARGEDAAGGCATMEVERVVGLAWPAFPSPNCEPHAQRRSVMADQPVICSRSGRVLEPHETAFVVDGQIVCREVHDELRPTCPYCHEALPAKPMPYSPCPHCRETILVRTNQDLYDSTLLTREQSEEFDRIDAIVRLFKPFGIRTRDYITLKEKLRSEMELDRDATDSEITWQFFHEAARRIAAGGGDPSVGGVTSGGGDATAESRQRLAELYLLQAHFVHAQGKDHRPIQQKWARTVLQAFKADGVTHVRLQGLPDDCLPSRRLHGQTLPIDDALADPPLPCPDCNHRLIVNEMKFRPAAGDLHAPRLSRVAGSTLRQAVADRPFCQCRYLPAEADAATLQTAADHASGDDTTAADPGADLLRDL